MLIRCRWCLRSCLLEPIICVTYLWVSGLLPDNLAPHLENGRLEPLSFWVHSLFIGPSNEDTLSYLPTKTVFICSSDPGLKFALHALVMLFHMFAYEWWLFFISWLSPFTAQVFFCSSVQVSGGFPNIHWPLSYWAELAFYFIIDVISAAVSPFSTLWLAG